MARASRRFLAAAAVAFVLRPLVAPVDALAQPAGPKPADAKPADAAPADAKALLAEGDKAAKAKDWPKALASYEAANKAQPSAEALYGVAQAHFQLKHDGEAHMAYAEWLDKYGASAPPAKRAEAQARVKALAKKTGAVALNVNEAGAAVLVDGKPAGTTPLAGPLRLTPGARQVRVEKDGFEPFDRAL